jgi:hypothetical protein
MSDLSNIGHSILIVACLYFGYSHGFEWWMIGLILFGLGTWNYAGYNKDAKRLLEAQIRLCEAKAEYFRRK